MTSKTFKEQHVATHVEELVKKTMQDTHKLDIYAEDALLSLTYSDNLTPSPFLEAIKYDDKAAIGRMLMDRIYTLVEGDVVSKLQDEAQAAEYMVERYEQDSNHDRHSEY